MNLEGVRAIMNQNKQLYQQTQQQLESIARQIDFLHSTTMNAQFPPWKPHSYLRMGEYQHQELRSFNHGKFMHPQSHNNSQNQQNTSPTPHNPPITQDSQRITNLEILIERMMKYQEVTMKNQEASIKRIEEQMQ